VALERRAEFALVGREGAALIGEGAGVAVVGGGKTALQRKDIERAAGAGAKFFLLGVERLLREIAAIFVAATRCFVVSIWPAAAVTAMAMSCSSRTKSASPWRRLSLAARARPRPSANVSGTRTTMPAEKERASSSRT